MISDVSRPLLTSYQETEGIKVLSTQQYTPAVVDVSDNLRSKIFGVFLKIGFNNLKGKSTLFLLLHILIDLTWEVFYLVCNHSAPVIL